MRTSAQQAAAIDRLRRALQKIADLPLDTPVLRGGRSRNLRVRRIAVSALKSLKD